MGNSNLRDRGLFRHNVSLGWVAARDCFSSSLVYLSCLCNRADFKATASRRRNDIFKQPFLIHNG